MRRAARSTWLVLLGSVLALLAAVLLLREPGHRPGRAAAPAAVGNDAGTAPAASLPTRTDSIETGRGSVDDELAAALDASAREHPLAEQELDRLVFAGARSFRDRLRQLLRRAESLPQAQRRTELEALREEVDRLQAKEIIVPVQALWLRVALLRAEFGADSEAFKARADALVAQARAEYERRNEQVQRQLVDANAAYRAAELELIRRIRAQQFPDESARQAELRRRLQALRAEMRAPSPAPAR